MIAARHRSSLSNLKALFGFMFSKVKKALTLSCQGFLFLQVFISGRPSFVCVRLVAAAG
jgi:hypothetical protein